MGMTKEKKHPVKKTVEDRVIDMIKGKLEVGSNTKVYRGSNLVEELGADSLDQVEIVMNIEDIFYIDIPDESVEKWKTVGDIIDYVKTKVSNI